MTDESLPEGLEPLNEENFSQELEALREDLLNWDCGHEPLGLENESE